MDMNGELVAPAPSPAPGPAPAPGPVPGPASDWASLPGGLLVRVADILTANRYAADPDAFLPSESEDSILPALSVCSDWNNQILAGVARLRILNFPPELSYYRLFRGLKHLRWSFSTFASFPTAHAAAFSAPRLRTLDISEPNSDENLTNIVEGVAPFGRLLCLRIQSGHSVSDLGYQQLGRLTSLTSLSITGATSMTDVSVRRIARLSSLKVLVIESSSNGFTDAGVRALASGLPGLEQLVITGCEGCTEAGIRHLADLRRLQLLVWGMRATDALLGLVTALPALQILSIDNPRNDFTDLALLPLADMPHLQGVRISCRHRIDSSLVALLTKPNFALLHAKFAFSEDRPSPEVVANYAAPRGIRSGDLGLPRLQIDLLPNEDDGLYDEFER